MIPDRFLRDTVERVCVKLNMLGVQYHLTGGVVSFFFGEPRMTQDLDIVIKLPPGKVAPLIAALQGEFYLDEEEVRKSLTGTRCFQALDNDTFVKVDFHVGEEIPGELDRSRRLRFLGTFEVPCVSKEDAILSKLLWIKKGSHKSRADVAAMLKDPVRIDRVYLLAKASELGVRDLLAELESESREQERD